MKTAGRRTRRVQAATPKLYTLADLKRDLKKQGQTLSRVPPRRTMAVRLRAAAGRVGATGDLELPGGYIGTGVNEWWIVSTIDDPPKVRQGSKRHTIYGCYSGNHVEDGGTQREKVLVIHRQDEEFLGQHGGSIDIFLQRPGTTDDRNMVRVETITTRYKKLYVPLILADGSIAGGGAAPAGQVAIQTHHGFVLCVTPQGRLETRTAIGPWETFRLVPVAQSFAAKPARRRKAA